MGDVNDETADLRERLEVFSAFMGGIIFEFDHASRYLRIWTGQPELLAQPAADMIGRTITDILGPTLGEMFQSAITRVHDTGEMTGFDYTLDVPAGRRTFSCEIRVREGHGGGGERTLTLLSRDVTEAKELEGKLLQAERLAALGLLAASVGHEIRQPLAYVLASLDVLDRELAAANLGERAVASVANIRSGSRRIAEIAASLDLLAGRRHKTPAPVDVRVPLQAALDLCASELARCARVERDTPELPRVRGDESELCQVFANLLLNAAQAQPAGPGTLPPSVRVRAELAGEMVRVTVQDTGAGIAREHLAHVFDPFFTTKDKGRGTGLGLFISRGIVEAHGGTLRITSEPGQGTSVEVLLPMAEPTLVRAPAASVHPDEPRRRLRILLVDDEPRFLESLRLALEADHDIEVQARGRDALDRLERAPSRYDIVLCDLAMPDVDGAEFHARMKTLGIADRFILMTGGAFTAHAADFIAAKACPMIAKPFLLEDLLALLDAVARKQQIA